MITNCLLFAFAITSETARQQANLIERIAAHNAECESIAEAESELKATPDSDWTTAHSKAVAKVRDRKLESLHNELSIRKEIGDFFTQVLNVDYPAAQHDADSAVNDAKQKATEHLTAGGWVTSKTEIASGVELLPIDLGVLMKNRDLCLAMLKSQAMNQASLIEARKKNAEAIDRAKEKFSAVKTKAMSLSI